MASDLADHLDSKLAEALQIGATAIEAIETLEERMNQEGAAVQNSMVSRGGRPPPFRCASAALPLPFCCRGCRMLLRLVERYPRHCQRPTPLRVVPQEAQQEAAHAEISDMATALETRVVELDDQMKDTAAQLYTRVEEVSAAALVSSARQLYPPHFAAVPTACCCLRRSFAAEALNGRFSARVE